ncbi:MAG: hypothetical protein K6E76_04800 [Patescibacteria group bacterium]|nr:hypothetical protein [Patescibacteria group bacterium]
MPQSDGAFYLNVSNGVGINTGAVTGVSLHSAGAIKIADSGIECYEKRAGTISYYSGCICACNGSFNQSTSPECTNTCSDSARTRCLNNSGRFDFLTGCAYKVEFDPQGGTVSQKSSEYYWMKQY